MTLAAEIAKLRIIKGLLIGSFLLTSAAVNAEPIAVDNSYVRETIPGTQVSSAYMRLTNTDTVVRKLVSASSTASPRVELHEHSMANGMMQMRQVPYIDIAAKQSVTLQPAGLHIMLFELKQPLKDGTSIDLTLHFANGQQQQVKLPVTSIKKRQHQHHH